MSDDRKAKRRLSKFNFEASGARVSLVGPLVGGPANDYEVLVTKSTKDISRTDYLKSIIKAADVQVTLSMEDFLEKFFGMWSRDAAALAVLLGYEVDVSDEYVCCESAQATIDNKLEGIDLLKSLHKGDDFFKLELADQKIILKAQEAFEKGLSSEVSSEGEVGSVIKKNSEDPTGDTMSEETKETLEEVLKSVADLKEALEAETAVRKSLEQKEDKRVELSFIEKAKGYSFIEDSEAEVFGKILKSLSEEDSLQVLTIFEKAHKAVEDSNSDMFEQKSTSGGAKVDLKNIEKSKQNVRKALAKLGVKVDTQEEGE